MKFAMFYEIPVPKPWGPLSEYEVMRSFELLGKHVIPEFAN
jgi:hypothetical protein